MRVQYVERRIVKIYRMQEVSLGYAVKIIFRRRLKVFLLSSYLGPPPPPAVKWDRQALPAKQREERIRESFKVLDECFFERLLNNISTFCTCAEQLSGCLGKEKN
jgi:hypothetical protein